MAFSATSLKNKSKGTATGAGYAGIMVAIKEELLIVPSPDEDQKAKIFEDFIFGSDDKGNPYTWIPIYSEHEKIKVTEEKQDGKNNSYTSKIAGFYPGDDEYIRSLVNDKDFGELDIYVMVSHCEEHTSLILGKGDCCPARAKLSFDSGDDGNLRGWNFEAEAKMNGVMCEYQGVGSSTKRFMVTANDATPDVSKGAGTYILPTNTAATEITGLDNAVPGNMYVLEWGSGEEHSTIADGAVFHLAAPFAAAKGAKLYLHCLKPNEFAERSRYIPS